jgi:hypothetical protein
VIEEDVVRCDSCVRGQGSALKLRIEDKLEGDTGAALVEDLGPDEVSIVGNRAVLVGGANVEDTIALVDLEPPFTVQRLADCGVSLISHDGTKVVYSSRGVIERGLEEAYQTTNVVNVIDVAQDPPQSYVVHPPFAAVHQNPSAYAPVRIPSETIEALLSPYSWSPDDRKVVFFEGHRMVSATKRNFSLVEIDLSQGLSSARSYLTPLEVAKLGNPKSKKPGGERLFRVAQITWVDATHIRAQLQQPESWVTDAWLSDAITLPLPSTTGAQPEGTPTLLPVFATPLPSGTP